MACRQDPFAGAPRLPGPPARTEWWSATVMGQQVGRQRRDFGPGQQVSWRSVFGFRSGDDVQHVYRAQLASCDEAGCTLTTAEGSRYYEGAVIPEVWPPAGPRTGAILDGGGFTPSAELTVHDAGARLSWLGPAGPVTVWLEDGAPWRSRLGLVSWQREGEQAPGWERQVEPVDVGRLLAIPVARWPRARRSLIGEYTVDGQPVRVDVPTWAELPAEREAVRALVMEIADAVRDEFVPGAIAGSGRGDCTEHALALVAAARERGYRARTAAGRVYVDGEEGGLLVLHAWAEIELGGRYVGADAALRQFPADASHLRLGEWVEDLASFDAQVSSSTGPRIEIRSLR
jgi:hypothetical protein